MPFIRGAVTASARSIAVVLLMLGGVGLLIPPPALAWSVFPIAPEIAPRNYTAVYDSAQDRLVAFGGEAGDYDGVDVLPLGTYPAWSVLRVPRGPSSRADHASVLDPERQRLLVIGGGLHSDVWELSLSPYPTWQELNPGGEDPAGWSGHSAVYDPVRDRVLVFGGARPGEDYGNEVWELTLSPTLAWHRVTTAGGTPPSRRDHGAIYDPVGDRMIVCDGASANGVLQDVWSLSLGGTPVWNAIPVPGTTPAGRSGHGVTYDPVRGRMLLFSGRTDPGVWMRELWALELDASPAWTQLSGPQSCRVPTGRFRSVLLYDSRRDRILAFGGRDSLGHRRDAPTLALSTATCWGDSLREWGDRPADGAVFASDANGQRLLAFGGGGTNEAWSASLDDPAPTWRRVAPPGPAPRARDGASLAFDARRNRLLLFSGEEASTYYRDSWALSLGPSPAWEELHPGGVIPPGRFLGGAAYDSVRDRMIVLAGRGGRYPTGNLYDLGDVHALSLSSAGSWNEIIPGGPPPRLNFGMTVDRMRNEVIVFGGAVDELRFGPWLALGDVWKLDLAQDTWQQIVPSGAALSARWGAAMADDPSSDGIGVFSGMSFSTWLSDCRRLTVDPAEWNPAPSLPLNESIVRGVALYSRDGSRIVLADETKAWMHAFPPPPPPPFLLVDCPDTQSWTKGGILPLAFALQTDLPGTQTADWEVKCDRAWPGFPLVGYSLLSGSGSAQVGIPVPDSAASGVVTLAFRAVVRGDPRANDSCEVRLRDEMTAIDVSFIQATVSSEHVVLSWFATDRAPDPFDLERRTENTSWEWLANVTANDQGWITYEDVAVAGGTRYAYQLSQDDGQGGRVFFGETTVEVPMANLSLRAPHPLPGSLEIVVDVVLPTASRAVLELFDVRGRMLATQDVGGFGAGSRRIVVDAKGVLRAGLYLVRLSQDGERLTTKVVLAP